jgi:hypothetical protein
MTKVWAWVTIAGCKVLGIEIMDDARRVQDHPFEGPTAFMLGNEVGTNFADSPNDPIYVMPLLCIYGSGRFSPHIPWFRDSPILRLLRLNEGTCHNVAATYGWIQEYDAQTAKP